MPFTWQYRCSLLQFLSRICLHAVDSPKRVELQPHCVFQTLCPHSARYKCVGEDYIIIDYSDFCSSVTQAWTLGVNELSY